MNIHVQEVAPEFRFELGASVDHRDGDKEGIVIERYVTVGGHERYRVATIYDDEGVLDYSTTEHFLVPFKGSGEFFHRRRAQILEGLVADACA